jgi:acetylornithine/succinyldiaminopimelate/putrescine aminotransferase
MMDSKSLFFRHLAQTSPFPFEIEVDAAKGIYIYDKKGKVYMDMISGVSVNNIGHCHPKVIAALKQQLEKHLHVMVYGEFIQESQNKMALALCSILPPTLNNVYIVNSGTEANEAAFKLAKRITGRTEMVSFIGSYHGSTHGSMSLSANETKKSPFRPLIPGVKFIRHNAIPDLKAINKETAGVIIETIQGDAGVRIPDQDFMIALRNRCSETGAQLIFDEVQVGMGRTGKMFAFEHFGVVPDILTLGKALGGGMSIGALVSAKEKMQLFSDHPILGHITTFGGHPMNCAASAATIDVLKNDIDFNEVERLGKLLENLLQTNSEIIEIRRKGLFFAIDMRSAELVNEVVKNCLENGLLSFWFLSHPYSFRLSPPLTITEEEIRKAASIILAAIETSIKNI